MGGRGNETTSWSEAWPPAGDLFHPFSSWCDLVHISAPNHSTQNISFASTFFLYLPNSLCFQFVLLNPSLCPCFFSYNPTYSFPSIWAILWASQQIPGFLPVPPLLSVVIPETYFFFFFDFALFWSFAALELLPSLHFTDVKCAPAKPHGRHCWWHHKDLSFNLYADHAQNSPIEVKQIQEN